MARYICINCGADTNAVPSRIGKAKFCSYACRGQWRSKHWLGENHPNWKGGEREKTCQYCGKLFSINSQPITSFATRKFCSKLCADKGGFRYEGENHPNWKETARHKNRRGKHGSWARAVIARDNATCRTCGATEVELHAHHIKPFATHPELRWELDNGLTLCHRCHWKVHTAPTANGVNSGKLQTGNAVDNPEPSNERKPIEGVTTRGQAYRRWNGSCEWCGTFLSKRWSDTAGKAHLFCSSTCSGKYAAAHRTYRRWKNAPKPTAVISSTSSPPERDDIV